jgi:hypothetical protein
MPGPIAHPPDDKEKGTIAEKHEKLVKWGIRGSGNEAQDQLRYLPDYATKNSWGIA